MHTCAEGGDGESKKEEGAGRAPTPEMTGCPLLKAPSPGKEEGLVFVVGWPRPSSAEGQGCRRGDLGGWEHLGAVCLWEMEVLDVSGAPA